MIPRAATWSCLLAFLAAPDTLMKLLESARVAIFPRDLVRMVRFPGEQLLGSRPVDPKWLERTMPA